MPNTGGQFNQVDKSKYQHCDAIVKFTSYSVRHRLFQMRSDLREIANDELKVIFMNEN